MNPGKPHLSAATATTGHRPAMAGRTATALQARLRASVLVIVMVTLMFATVAVVAFIEKASNDLLVEAHEISARRLRAEAYSALEVTLAVLADFQEANNGLHSAAEGWSDPLAFADWSPSGGRTVEVAFEDESGKISLPRADAAALVNLFKAWEIPPGEAERLADALLGWMKPGHIYTSALLTDYDREQVPYDAPLRPLRSFNELAAIDVVREMFYDETGQPNELWHRFADNVSLYDFGQPNLNGAKPDVLAGLGQLSEIQQKSVDEYLHGTGAYKNQGPSWFSDPASAQAMMGKGNTASFGATISALRVNITVHDGTTEFKLSAVVAPPKGATTVQTNATLAKAQVVASANKPAPTPGAPGAPAAPAEGTPAGATPNGLGKKLNYPFTLLEIRENNEIPSPPPPPPAQT
jgi:Type II secretion system (T2SS), protein K